MIASRVVQQPSRASGPSPNLRGGGGTIQVPGSPRPLATQRVIRVGSEPNFPPPSSSTFPPDQDSALDINSRRGAGAHDQIIEEEQEEEKGKENSNSAIQISLDADRPIRKMTCCRRTWIFVRQCVCPSRTMAQLTECEGPLTGACLRITRARFALVVMICLFATAALSAHSACEARRDAFMLHHRELNMTTPAGDGGPSEKLNLVAAILPDQYCSVSNIFAIAGIAMIFCVLCAFACFGRVAFAWQKAMRSE